MQLCNTGWKKQVSNRSNVLQHQNCRDDIYTARTSGTKSGCHTLQDILKMQPRNYTGHTSFKVLPQPRIYVRKARAMHLWFLAVGAYVQNMYTMFETNSSLTFGALMESRGNLDATTPMI
eukprot:gnl/TRDRNA2_/TRDRNA2_200836_c0_seq1.p1 gnl/TRDRNA2_/TRDRNA2_200836_c0~~gnl/TRDRNA2_/TRDRNA2_200836_c0_seq1.p1  ORF type:complete len:120 (-),score=6.95 gnl/TRDRNA2_/TRDRNA2_200836_c0_seq1:20-379(-)